MGNYAKVFQIGYRSPANDHDSYTNVQPERCILSTTTPF